jgi:hypothetical protein
MINPLGTKKEKKLANLLFGEWRRTVEKVHDEER